MECAVKGDDIETGTECVDLALRAFLLSVSCEDHHEAYARVNAYVESMDDEALRTVFPHMALFPRWYYGRLDDRRSAEFFWLLHTWSGSPSSPESEATQ